MHRLSRRAFLGVALAAPLGLIACDGGQSAADSPPELAIGRDVCDRCGMIVSEARYAAGLVDAAGASRNFDDVGEMIMTVREEGLQGRRAWAHDLHSEQWIDATTAVYVQGALEMTPMGTGIVALATREDAEAFAREGEGEGTPLSWDEAIAG